MNAIDKLREEFPDRDWWSIQQTDTIQVIGDEYTTFAAFVQPGYDGTDCQMGTGNTPEAAIENLKKSVAALKAAKGET